MPRESRSMVPHMRKWAAIALAAGFLALALGFWLTPLPESLSLRHPRVLATTLILALLAALVLARGLRLRLGEALLLVLLIAHLVFAKAPAALAVLTMLGAALALGLRFAGSAAYPALAALVGLAVIAAISGWLLPFKLHHDWLYLSLGVAVIVRQRVAVAKAAGQMIAGFRRAVRRAPVPAAWAMLALFAASIGSWLPTVQHDDLAYHLALPAELAALGYYRMDASSQIWALAPWAGDVLHGIAQLLAGREARGTLNLLWLGLGGFFLHALVRRLGGGHALAWWAVALWASQPLLVFLVGGMQTELPAMVAVLAAGERLAAPRPCLRQGSTLVVLAILAGFLLALKASHLITVAALGLWLLLRWRGPIAVPMLGRALIASLLVGGSSYAYAALLTGNPLFPLFNALFRSPELPPENFRDLRFGSGWLWDAPWQLSFATERFFEGRAGAAGFALLALLALTIVAVVRKRTRGAALAALAIALLTFWQIHYLRYLLPALSLLLAAQLAALRGLTPRTAALAMAPLCALQLLFQGASWWILDAGALSRTLDDPSGRQLLARFAPERLLVRWLDPGHRVLYLARPSGAELAGRGFSLSHYDPALGADPRWREPPGSGQDPLIAAAWDHGITHILMAGHPDPAAIGARIRAAGGAPMAWEYDAQLWALPLAPDHPRRDLRRERDRARALRRAWR